MGPGAYAHHLRHHGFDRAHGAEVVDLHLRPERLDRHLEKEARGGPTGVADERVNWPKSGRARKGL